MSCKPTVVQTQYYTTWITFNGTPIPMQPGLSMQNPRNLNIPLIAGNYVGVNFGEGTREAVVTFTLVVLTGQLGFLFTDTAGIMGRLLARTAPSSGHDTLGNDVVINNGRYSYSLTDAKVEAVSVSVAKPNEVRMNVTLVAPCVSKSASAGGGYSFQGYGAVATFANCNFLTNVNSLSDAILSYQVEYRNNHTPSPELNGNVLTVADGYPASFNAGTATATAVMSWQAINDGIVANGTGVTFIINNGAGTGSYVSLLSGSLQYVNPEDQTLAPPRITLQRQFTILGFDNTNLQWTNASDNPLLAVTSTNL